MTIFVGCEARILLPHFNKAANTNGGRRPGAESMSQKPLCILRCRPFLATSTQYRSPSSRAVVTCSFGADTAFVRAVSWVGGFPDVCIGMPLWPAGYLLVAVIATAVGCWSGSACSLPLGYVWVGTCLLVAALRSVPGILFGAGVCSIPVT